MFRPFITGVKDGDKLIAWSITENTSEGCIAYSALYTDEKYRNRGLGIGMLAESYRKQLTLGVLKASCIIRHDNSEMLNLFKKRLSSGADIIMMLSSHKEV